MLPALNGNKNLKHTRVFFIEDSTHVSEARRFATLLAAELGFDEARAGRAAIIINEMGNNLIKYAKQGRLLVQGLLDGSGIEILAVDSGPGFNISQGMMDGFTTGSTPGTGLGAIKRQADDFDIFSDSRGTIIFTRLYLTTPSRELQWEIAGISVTYPGEQVCGDGWDFRVTEDMLEILAVDGLGHGQNAYNAAIEAIQGFQSAKGLDPERTIQSLHARLKSTRGGAVFVTQVKEKSIRFSGVGNIRTVLQMPFLTKTLISQNGTAGLQVRTAKTLSQDWDGTGYLILHSDGIGTKWILTEYPGLQVRHPAILAAVIYRDALRGTDDATVIVARRKRN